MSENTAPLTHLRPYDASMEEPLTMYDHLPYRRDVSLCDAHSIALESGNILKYYRCAVKDARSISNRDTNIEIMLNKKRKHSRKPDQIFTDTAEQLPEQDYSGLFEDVQTTD